MRIVNFVGSRYTVQNLITNKLEDYHITQLRPFNYEPEFINPTDIAQRDKQMEEVDHIVTHKGNSRYKSKMTFKVRWKSCNESDDSWLSWQDLRNNSALHEYLNANKMRKLIPIEYTTDSEDEA
jgi:hypothetical protein